MNNRIYLNCMTKMYHEFIKEHAPSERVNPSGGSCKGACCGGSSAEDSSFTGCVKDAYGRNDTKGKASGAAADTGPSKQAGMSPAFAGRRSAASAQLLSECLQEPEAAGTISGTDLTSSSAELETLYDKMALICGCSNAECSQAEILAVRTREEMTLEEYKKYIYDKIASIPMHPSQSKNSVSVYITDAGFEAMKNDPEYEAWVLDTLRRDFSCNDPWGAMGSGKYVFHTFGATREEYRGHSFAKEDPNAARRRKKEESFWEKRRLRQKKRQKEYYEELMKKRALIRRIQQQLFIEKDISWAAAAYEAKKMVH